MHLELQGFWKSSRWTKVQFYVCPAVSAAQRRGTKFWWSWKNWQLSTYDIHCNAYYFISHVRFFFSYQTPFLKRECFVLVKNNLNNNIYLVLTVCYKAKEHMQLIEPVVNSLLAIEIGPLPSPSYVTGLSFVLSWGSKGSDWKSTHIKKF